MKWTSFLISPRKCAVVTKIAKENEMNLDAMTPDELWEFYQKHRCGGKYKDLFPKGGKGTKIATAKLASYAINKYFVITRRLSGNIEGAICYERCADGIYESLPDFAKW